MPALMPYEEMQNRLETDSDFIALKRFDYSMKELMLRYPDGVPSDRLIAQALLMTEEELDIIFEEIVNKLRKNF